MPTGGLTRARINGKENAYCKAVGGFVVARMSEGGYDWFPTGQPPQVDGQLDRNAEIVERWYWNGVKWGQVRSLR